MDRHKSTRRWLPILLLISSHSLYPIRGWSTARSRHRISRTKTTLGSVKGVTVKIAVDSNGGAADLSAERSERFTCGDSLDAVHRLRAVSDAVLVGRGTVQADNPSLTIRRIPWNGPQPHRIIIDPKLKLIGGNNYTLFHDGHSTIVVHCEGKLEDQSATVKDLCIESIDGDIDLKSMMAQLSNEFGVEHLMVEGGSATVHSFLRSGLVDRLILVRAVSVTFLKPLKANLSESYLSAANLQKLGTERCGDDQVDFWSKDGSWPTSRLLDWP